MTFNQSKRKFGTAFTDSSKSPQNALMLPPYILNDESYLKRRESHLRRLATEASEVSVEVSTGGSSGYQQDAGSRFDDESSIDAETKTLCRPIRHLSEKQKVRKRESNRLSAQKKRTRERFMLQSLPERYHNLSKANEDLKADNRHMEELLSNLIAQEAQQRQVEEARTVEARHQAISLLGLRNPSRALELLREELAQVDAARDLILEQKRRQGETLAALKSAREMSGLIRRVQSNSFDQGGT